MKNRFFVLLAILMFVFGANAQTKKNGTPDMRYKANKQAYSNTYANPSQHTRTQTITSRPIYSGQTHTTSHGGSYPGSINSHHKGGHYVNPNTQNHYGIHKIKRK